MVRCGFGALCYFPTIHLPDDDCQTATYSTFVVYKFTFLEIACYIATAEGVFDGGRYHWMFGCSAFGK